jgi:hypothetical protein
MFTKHGRVNSAQASRKSWRGLIDQHGIIRYKRIMDDPDHALDAQEMFTTVQKIVAGMQ